MSDDVSQATEPGSGGADGSAASFGARLAAAREAAGLSVGEMAARLRLHVNQVRAIEAEDLAQLPEGAYVRGFVRSYARAVDLDPGPLIEDLNRKAPAPSESVVDGMTRARDFSPVRAAARERASRSLVLGFAVVAMVVLGVVGWLSTRQPAPEPAPVASTPPSAPVAAEAPVPATVPADPPAPAATAGDPSASPVEAPARGTDAVEPVPAPASAPEPPKPAPDPTVLLSLQFNGESWVEVTDAGGKVLVSQLAHDGDVLRPRGTPPLSVVLGAAPNVVVTVRGQALDLAAVTRANVARFTVK